MRRITAVWMIVLMLCSCMPREYETVCDAIPTADPADAPFEICIRVPPEAELAQSAEDMCVWEARNGDYTITARILVTDGLDAAVYALTGSVHPQLRITMGEARECQLAWCEQTSRGPAICRALCRLEGDFCYCLCLRLKAGLAARYNEQINALFSSFALVPKESADIPPARSRESPDSGPRTSRYRRSAPPPWPRRGWRSGSARRRRARRAG